jgi:2-aminoadipate transaminase
MRQQVFEVDSQAASPAEPRFARRAANLQPSVIRELLKAAQQPDTISFGGGLPAAELFPLEAIAQAQARALQQRGAAALQYSVTEGIPSLRAWVADRLTDRGSGCAFEHVIVTAGSQQGLDLYARVFLDPGDVVVIEAPAYLGAIQAFNAYEPRYLTIPSNDGGIDPDALQAKLRSAPVLPKFLYIVPNYANPSGVTLRAERRDRVVEICARFGLPILEDDPYGDLFFSEPPPAPLFARQAAGNISYLGTASKMAAPGLRVAWLVVPDARLRAKIVAAKQGADLHTGTYAQEIFRAFVDDDARLESHLAMVRDAYRMRSDAMRAALAANMPSHVRWNVPEGGMFLWASVGAGLDTERVFENALRDGVVFVPGRPFYPGGSRGDGMRLNFTAMDAARIRDGIERLARAIARTPPFASKRSA